jgi:O-antigen/teichoic acid export membrane protein
MNGQTPHKGALAARGVVAFAGMTLAKYVLSLLRIAVLARLLSPEAFGLVGLGVTFLKGLETVTALGPEKYLIQRRELSAELIGSAFWLRASLGLLTGIVAVLSASLYEEHAHAPGAAEVLSIIAASSVLRGFKSPGTFLAERELRFRRVALFELAMTASEVAIAILLAQLVGGARSLALGLVAAALLETMASYAVFRVLSFPTPTIDGLREILSVGGAFLVISIGSFLMVQGDNYIVGVTLGVGLLGQYIVAYRLCELPLQLTQQITSRVALSVFSRIQHDQAQKTAGFLRMLDAQLLLLAPASAGVLALAGSLVTVVYGREWSEAAPCLRALGFVMFGRGISNMVAPYLVANGHFGYAARVKLVETAVFVVGVWVGATRMGLVGAALGAGAGYLVAGALRFVYLVRVENVPARPLAWIVARAVAMSVPAASIGFLIDQSDVGSPVARLAIGLVAFGLCYGTIVVVSRRAMLLELMALAKLGFRRR